MYNKFDQQNVFNKLHSTRTMMFKYKSQDKCVFEALYNSGS